MIFAMIKNKLREVILMWSPPPSMVLRIKKISYLLLTCVLKTLTFLKYLM